MRFVNCEVGLFGSQSHVLVRKPHFCLQVPGIGQVLVVVKEEGLQAIRKMAYLLDIVLSSWEVREEFENYNG